MSSSGQSKFMFFSFLPAIAYWYLEQNYPVHIAVIGGLSLGVVEIIFEKIYFGKVHKIAKINFFLIGVLGGFSLLGDDGIWFKLQPLFTGLIMGGYLLYKSLKDEGMMWEMMSDMKMQMPPKEVWAPLEKRFSIFMVAYGIFMGAIALTQTTDVWLFFKTAGLYICFFIYFIFEFLILRKKLSVK